MRWFRVRRARLQRTSRQSEPCRNGGGGPGAGTASGQARLSGGSWCFLRKRVLCRQAARPPSASHPTKRASSDSAPSLARDRLLEARVVEGLLAFLVGEPKKDPADQQVRTGNEPGRVRAAPVGSGRHPVHPERGPRLEVDVLRAGVGDLRVPGRPRSRRPTDYWPAPARRTASAGPHDLPFLPSDHLWLPCRGIRNTVSRRSSVVQTSPHPPSGPSGK